MPAIAVSLEVRILHAAGQQLGPRGEEIVSTIARARLNTPLERVTYLQLPELFAAVERTAPAQVDWDIAAVLIQGIETIRLEHLSRLERQRTAAAGTETGGAPAVVLTESGAALGPALIAMAAAGTGEDGAEFMRALCRRLDVDLDAVDIEGLSVLIREIRQDGTAPLGARRVQAFLDAARVAGAAPYRDLQQQLRHTLNHQLGPAGAVLLERICQRNGLPAGAVAYEHLGWLATELRDAAAAIVGAAQAAAVEHEVTRMLSRA